MKKTKQSHQELSHPPQKGTRQPDTGEKKTLHLLSICQHRIKEERLAFQHLEKRCWMTLDVPDKHTPVCVSRSLCCVCLFVSSLIFKKSGTKAGAKVWEETSSRSCTDCVVSVTLWQGSKQDTRLKRSNYMQHTAYTIYYLSYKRIIKHFVWGLNSEQNIHNMVMTVYSRQSAVSNSETENNGFIVVFIWCPIKGVTDTLVLVY